VREAIVRIEQHAGVAELADAQDLKSWVAQAACGFDSRPRHHNVHDGPRSEQGMDDDPRDPRA
jgi:hypothetical protein